MDQADESRQGRQQQMAGRDAWGNFPAASGGFSGEGDGGVSSMTAGFQAGMDFSGAGDAPAPQRDPFAYVGGEANGAGGAAGARGPVAGTPAQQAAQQQAVPKLEHVLQEAIEDPRNKTQLLRYEQDVQKFLRDASAQMFSFPAMGGYHRLMVHRLAEYYCMEHEVDEGGVSPQAIYYIHSGV